MEEYSGCHPLDKMSSCLLKRLRITSDSVDDMVNSCSSSVLQMKYHECPLVEYCEVVDVAV